MHENVSLAFDVLQRDIIIITQKWLFNNQIYINDIKTKLMIVKSPHKQINIDNLSIKAHNRSCLSSYNINKDVPISRLQTKSVS